MTHRILTETARGVLFIYNTFADEVSHFVRKIVSVLHSSFFFFSSRRRHTRLQGDWSSDVCSSDLTLSTILIALVIAGHAAAQRRVRFGPTVSSISIEGSSGAGQSFTGFGGSLAVQIGRASCRERV